MEYSEKYFGLSNRIAKWKEPSEFENELAIAAETDLKIRSLYAKYYKELNPAYYVSGKKMASGLFESHRNDFNNLDFESIYEDMVYCLHHYGLSFQDYCIYSLWNKSEYCRKEFVSDKLRYYYCDILNAPDVEELMTDKLSCYNEYNEFFRREMVPVKTIADKAKFLDFVRRNTKFVYKPLREHSGHGICLLDSESQDMEQWFDFTIKNRPGIAEQLIIQGHEMNQLNPSSINSCRVVTFTIGNDVTIIGATLRMGVGNALTDNAGSGGIYASIDPESGIIQSTAKNYLNQQFLFHPSTHTKILGYQLPDWESAKDAIHKMATHRKGTRLISWDIAYDKDGWRMVEANDNGDWSIIQSNFGIGKKRLLFNLMDEYFNTNPE